jgi:hypothetical protein
MTQFNRIALALFTAFLPIFTFAQIQKGSYNFGGDVGLTSASSSSKFFKAKALNLNFSPTVSKFVTNNWLVGVQPILGLSNQKVNYTNLGSIEKLDISNNLTSVGLGVSSRYYGHLSPKISIFALVDASYRKNTYGFLADGIPTTGQPELKFDYNVLKYSAGFGLNVALKSDVFLEAKLTYQKTELSNFSNQTGNRYFANSEVTQLNIGLNHFVFDLKSKSEGTPQYVKRGRQVLGGNMIIEKVKNRYNGYLTPEFGQFVADNLLVSAKVNYYNFGNGQFGNTKYLTATIGARYYIPLRERLFIHPELIYTNQIAGGDGGSALKNVVDFNIGGSYFLSKNVAIEANLLQSHFYLLPKGDTQNQIVTGALGLGTIGLRYFIR